MTFDDMMGKIVSRISRPSIIAKLLGKLSRMYEEPVLNLRGVVPPAECKGCGKCCEGIPLRRMHKTPRLDAEKELYTMRDLQWKKVDGIYYLFSSPCIHLSADKSCNIYARRPHVCMDDKRGGVVCLKYLKMHGADKVKF
jgi:hypothetical protein